MRRDRQNLIPSIKWVNNEDVHYNFNDEGKLSDSLPDRKILQPEKKIMIISAPIEMMIIN